VLVVAMEPLRVYVYKEGLVRLATQKYSMEHTAKHAHLTNFSLNKNTSEFRAAKDMTDTSGFKQSFAALERHLQGMGHDTEKVFRDIHAVCLKTVIASHHHCTPHNSCFQLLGFDVMLDNKLKPWVIEVNAGLSLSYDTSDLDAAIKGNAIVDLLNLVGISSQPVPKADSDGSRHRSPETDPLRPAKEEFRRHVSGPNGWVRVFPTEKSAQVHLPLFRRPGELTSQLVAAVSSNPRYAQGSPSKDEGAGIFVFQNVAGPHLRRQFKAWKKTKKKKKSHKGDVVVQRENCSEAD